MDELINEICELQKKIDKDETLSLTDIKSIEIQIKILLNIIDYKIKTEEMHNILEYDNFKIKRDYLLDHLSQTFKNN